jgi:hypothetical protein
MTVTGSLYNITKPSRIDIVVTEKRNYLFLQVYKL